MDDATHDAVCETVRRLAEPILADLGLEWVESQYGTPRSGGRLKVVIDKQDGGVTLEDCAQVSRRLSQALDAGDVIAHRYHLEVSSPGLDRTLTQREDFARFVGSKMRLETRLAMDGKKVFVGRLIAFKEDVLRVSCDTGEHLIPFSDVAKARLEVEF